MLSLLIFGFLFSVVSESFITAQGIHIDHNEKQCCLDVSGVVFHVLLCQFALNLTQNLRSRNACEHLCLSFFRAYLPPSRNASCNSASCVN